MKKTSLLNIAAPLTAVALLSVLPACAHTPKNTTNEHFTFSFMGHKLYCREKTLDNGLTSYYCKSSRMKASFFQSEENYIQNPDEPVHLVEKAINKKYTTEKESFLCPDDTYVTTMRIFKGKKKTLTEEILLHIKSNGFMFIEHTPKKNDLSILTPEAVENLCYREDWLLPDNALDKTKEENTKSDL